MKVVFAGTPAFALPTLQALLEAGHTVLAVYTQPDRPAGRGRRIAAAPVKEFARRRALRLSQPERLGEHESAELRALAPEVIVVVAYGLILPPAILTIPRHGCLNVHASLLPRWRGAAPIARAIEAGDRETGVCIMQMETGLDTGPILGEARVSIEDNDTAATLQERLAPLGAQLLVSTLRRLERGAVHAVPQDATRACYAPKLRKDEGVLDWSRPAIALQRKVRAFNPWPVTTTMWNGRRLRLWEAAPVVSPTGTPHAAPGVVLAVDEAGIHVATGDGVLTLTRLQVEGGKVLSANEFANGYRMRAGDRLG